MQETVVEETIVKETTGTKGKKRTRMESDTSTKSKKKRANKKHDDDDDDDYGDSGDSTHKKKAEIPKVDSVVAEKPTSTVQTDSDDLDPFDYPFDTTPVTAPPSKLKKGPAPATKPLAPPATSKPSRAAASKVKYVEIFSDDDDSD